MQTKWTGKNIDLDLLSGQVERFFFNRGFKTLKEKLADGYKILGVLSRANGKRESICAKIFGNPDEFVVEFEPIKPSYPSRLLAPMATLIGAGGFVLRDLKSREVYEKLEREFWAYVEETVSNLVDSSRCAR